MSPRVTIRSTPCSRGTAPRNCGPPLWMWQSARTAVRPALPGNAPRNLAWAGGQLSWIGRYSTLRSAQRTQPQPWNPSTTPSRRGSSPPVSSPSLTSTPVQAGVLAAGGAGVDAPGHQALDHAGRQPSRFPRRGGRRAPRHVGQGDGVLHRQVPVEHRHQGLQHIEGGMLLPPGEAIGGVEAAVLGQGRWSGPWSSAAACPAPRRWPPGVPVRIGRREGEIGAAGC